MNKSYPRKCRKGHSILSAKDEKTSGHRQCLQCRRDSQDRARMDWIMRWWFEECEFTKEQAREIQLAGRRAWQNVSDNTPGSLTDKNFDPGLAAIEAAEAAEEAAMRECAAQFPEGNLEKALA